MRTIQEWQGEGIKVSSGMSPCSNVAGFISKLIALKWWMCLLLASQFTKPSLAEVDGTTFNDEPVVCHSSCLDVDPYGFPCQRIDSSKMSCTGCGLPSCYTLSPKQEQFKSLFEQFRLRGGLSTAEVNILLDSMELPQAIISKINLHNITTAEELDEVVVNALLDCVRSTRVEWSVSTSFPRTSTYARFEAILTVRLRICGRSFNPRFTGDVTVFFIARRVEARINGVQIRSWDLSSRRRLIDSNFTDVLQSNTTVVPLNAVRGCIGIPYVSFGIGPFSLGLSACAAVGIRDTGRQVAASFSAFPRAEARAPIGSRGIDLSPSWSRDVQLTYITFTWITFSWAPCASSCRQTRSVICRRSDGVTVSDSQCSDDKPMAQQACQGGECPINLETGPGNSTEETPTDSIPVESENPEGTPTIDGDSGTLAVSYNTLLSPCLYSVLVVYMNIYSLAMAAPRLIVMY